LQQYAPVPQLEKDYQFALQGIYTQITALFGIRAKNAEKVNLETSINSSELMEVENYLFW